MKPAILIILSLFAVANIGCQSKKGSGTKTTTPACSTQTVYDQYGRVVQGCSANNGYVNNGYPNPNTGYPNTGYPNQPGYTNIGYNSGAQQVNPCAVYNNPQFGIMYYPAMIQGTWSCVLQ